MTKKPFKPLDTARINLAELGDGRVVPTAPVLTGLLAGTPISVMIIDALIEAGVPIGPKVGTVIGIVISAALSYITRGGRRQVGDRK